MRQFPSLPSSTYNNTQRSQSHSLRLIRGLVFFVISLICLNSVADAAIAVRVNDSITVNYRSYDPFQGEADFYSISGILMIGTVQVDCTVRVAAAASQTGQAIIGSVNQQYPLQSIIALGYDWLDNCATFDDIFTKIGSLEDQLASMALPKIGAIVMHGDAASTEDFGAPFTQLASAKHWNQEVRLNASYIGSDSYRSLALMLADNGHAALATVDQERGPWNEMWRSVGFNIVIRALDVLAGLIFVYGIWVLMFIIKAKQEMQHKRRYMVLIPGCIYLPLSIAFAPYKVTLPWRNAVYYFSLLLPFISLGLNMIMWGTLIYRIHRKKMNKVFSYFAYVTILVPVISAFLDGIGWLIPSVPMIRMIGEKGFSFATPAVILVQASVIFYYAATFFKSLKGVAVSQTTRTALVKITVLNLAMISFFILMLLSRIVSLMGLNMRIRAAYITELVVFRFSFLFFYAACFRTLSIRQPTGSTVDSKGNSSANGNGNSNGATKNSAKNHTHFNMKNMSGNTASHSGDVESKNDNRPPTIRSPRLPHAFASQQNLIAADTSSDYPDPYKFDEFGHLKDASMNANVSGSGDSYIGMGGADEEDKDSIYGSHRFQNSHGNNHHSQNGNVGRVVGGKGMNSEGYSRFDVSDEER
ncbi:hypothetical protein BGZ76_003714, partial [Entomortierella beljakovae]